MQKRHSHMNSKINAPTNERFPIVLTIAGTVCSYLITADAANRFPSEVLLPLLITLIFGFMHFQAHF